MNVKDCGLYNHRSWLYRTNGSGIRLVNNQLAFVPQEVKISSAPFLLLRIPSLKIKTTLRKETFEVNLKSEVDLWHLMVKEMWAGRKMADDHKVVCQNVIGKCVDLSLGACQFI
jgi:hypothetical protein